MTAPDSIPRVPTPRPLSLSFRVINKPCSFQVIDNWVPLSSTHSRSASPSDSLWPSINVVSPTIDSRHSEGSDAGLDINFDSPPSTPLDEEPSHAFDEMECSIRSANTTIAGDEWLYDIASEDRPEAPYFEPSFQETFARLKQDMKDIEAILGECAVSEQMRPQFQMAREKAYSLVEDQTNSVTRIAVVGNRDVGKSRLISALLDLPSLLSPMSFVPDNSSCGLSSHEKYDTISRTNIFTEYHCQRSGQTDPFVIEAEFPTSEEVRGSIQELLRSFLAIHDSAFKDIEDLDEQCEIRDRSEAAWNTLQVMFWNYPSFCKDYLLKNWRIAEKPPFQALEEWANKTLAARMDDEAICLTVLEGKSIWTATASNLDEVTTKLLDLAGNSMNHGKLTLWPFIRIVRVYLESPALYSGMVLADCPAPSMLNYASARDAERYLRSCREVFVTTTVAGALSDPIIADMVQRNGNSQSLNIICTESDKIDARQVELKDSEISGEARTWRQQISGLQKQLRICEAQRRHGVANALEEEVRCRDTLEEMEFGRKRFLVERRNGQVALQLIKKYAGCTQASTTKVFCVSSDDYFEHRVDYQERAMSRLSLSGIVDLRKHCHLLAARERYEQAAIFMEHKVPEFMLQLRLLFPESTIGGDHAASEDIQQLVEGPAETLKKQLVTSIEHLHSSRSALQHDFATAIVEPMREHSSEWRKAAIATSKEWANCSEKDYAAFCRHYGIFATDPKGPRNWNEELTAPVRKTLQSNWDFFHETAEENRRETLQSIHRIFEGIRSSIPAPSSEVSSPPELHGMIDHRLAILEHRIHEHWTQMLDSTHQLELDTLHGHLSSYMNALMVPAYHATSLINPPAPPHTVRPSPASPSAHDPRRKDTITSHVASGRLFPRLAGVVEQAHSSLVDTAFESIAACMSQEVVAVVSDLQTIALRGVNGWGMDVHDQCARCLRSKVTSTEAVLQEAALVLEDLRIMHGMSSGSSEFD